MFPLVPYRLPNGRVSLAFVSLELGELGKTILLLIIVMSITIYKFLEFLYLEFYEFSLNKHINNGLIVPIAQNSYSQMLVLVI